VSDQTTHEFGSPIDAPGIPRECRLRLMHEIDVLGFALEMEMCEWLRKAGATDMPIRSYYERSAALTERIRLGVRLAHRVVSGVYSDEAQGRIEKWRAEYERRCTGYVVQRVDGQPPEVTIIETREIRLPDPKPERGGRRRKCVD
jgi:hypothetical protein